MLLVGLPVGDPDPLSRLATIHESTQRLKTRLGAGGGDVLDVLRLPTPAARLAVRWMRRIAGRGINLFVTNVPGPAAPLWLAGARLLEAVPVAPLIRGVPLGIAALSYTATLSVSVDADAAIDDLDVLIGGIDCPLASLLDAARSFAPARPCPRRVHSRCCVRRGRHLGRWSVRGPLVAQQRGGAARLGRGQPEVAGSRLTGEQPPAGAEHHGEDQQAVLVDELAPHQRVHDAGAADDDHVPFAPQALDLVGQLAGKDRGVRPRADVGQRP